VYSSYVNQANEPYDWIAKNFCSFIIERHFAPSLGRYLPSNRSPQLRREKVLGLQKRRRRRWRTDNRALLNRSICIA
jgi:hypothetical protein